MEELIEIRVSPVAYRAEVIEPVKAIVKKPRLVKYGLIKMGFRQGRGFSLGELEAVGLSVEDARRLGLYVDTRRSSVREENIRILEEFLAKINLEER